jgi:hypothetical protein
MPNLVDREAPPWTAVCLNCNAPLTGPFCSGCGQRAVPPHPTTRELAGDAWAELIGWDGKFATTIRLLLRRPGELTRVLLEGRRAQYISPVRLYLMCSVLYFIVAAGAPLPDVNMELDVGIGFGADADPQTPGQAALAEAVTKGLAKLDPAGRALVESEIAAQPRIAQPLLRAMAEDYPALMRRAGEVIPRALFVLIPALALILALFYRSRHYPEHLYFAIHVEAFTFLALTVVALAQYTSSLPMLAIAQACVWLWILSYFVIALRRVYGGSWPATGLKALGIVALFGLLWSITVLSVTLWASRAG